MHRHLLCLFLFWAPGFCCLAQQNGIPGPEIQQDTQTERLLGLYLRSPDSAEYKIQRLLGEAAGCARRNNTLGKLNCLLLALSLESGAPPDAPVLFELNRQLGSDLVDLNLQYALYFNKKALDIGRRRFGDSQDALFSIMGSIAGICRRLAQPDSAEYWFRLAVQVAYKFHKNVAQASALNNLGYFYSDVGARDSALYYYGIAARALDDGPVQNKSLYCSIRDNIAREQERIGDYGPALRIYRSNDSILSALKRPSRILLNRIHLIGAAQKMGLPDAGLEIERLAGFVGQYRDSMLEPEVLQFYQAAKDYYLENGPLARARLYDSLYVHWKDRIEFKNKERIELIAGAFLRVQTIRFWRDAEVARLESLTARQSLRVTRQFALLLLVTGLAVFGLFALWMHKRRRESDLAHRLTRAELHSAELEARAIADALEFQKRDTTTLALHNTWVLDNQRRLVERLGNIADRKKDQEVALRELIREIQVQEQLGDRVQVVQTNIDRVNAGFYHVLLNKFPGLSRAEVELCGYLRVGLSSKEIAVLRNIAPSSVKMSKNRLRKKLGLGADEDLYAFVQGL